MYLVWRRNVDEWIHQMKNGAYRVLQREEEDEWMNEEEEEEWILGTRCFVD